MSTTNPPPPRRHRTSSAFVGARGEKLAAEHLAAAGMVVVARNWRIADGDLRGELDLVARDGDTLVIVEVKTRSGLGYGTPLEAVTPRKQAAIRRLASAFLREAGLRVAAVRFDVVGVVLDPDGPRLTHLRGAF